MTQSFISNAQEFYSADDIEIGWKYWSSESSLYYLCDNGNKVNLSCIPILEWDGASFSNPAEIVSTYIHKNKFLVLSFSKLEGIRLRNSSRNDKDLLNDINPIIDYLDQQSWYEINFDKISYDVIYNQLLIPCGIDNKGQANAICIKIKTPSSTKAVYTDQNFNESNTKYYDLQGKQVDINMVNDQIIIKTDGFNSTKIYKK